jgi:putative ABC transport system permease protein
MFIALRDLAYARGRFLLMGLVVALVAFLMTLLSGLSAGLLKSNISGLMALPVTHIAFEYDDRPAFGTSMVDREMWAGWQETAGVVAVRPLGTTLFSARSDDARPLEIALWGVQPGSFLEPPVIEGEPLGRLAGGVIISRSLAAKGLTIGDTITLDRVLTELEVVGVTHDLNLSHVPIVYAPLRKWQEATYGPPGGAPPGEKLPAILFDFATVIALQLEPSADVRAVDAALGTLTLAKEDAYAASMGYTEEMFSVRMIQGVLILISAVVIGAFFAVWTIQRTQEVGLVKALGASDWYLLKDALAQALILMLGATVVGVAVGVSLGTVFERSGSPFMLQAGTVALSAGLLLLAGLIGGALSIRMITRIDPIIALGRVR